LRLISWTDGSVVSFIICDPCCFYSYDLVTSSWTSAPPSCMSLDAWLAASGATWEVVWRRFDLYTI